MQVKTFDRKQDAEAWGRAIETKIDRKEFIDKRVPDSTTLSQALDWYIEKIIPGLKQQTREVQRVRHLQKFQLAKLSVSRIATADVSEFVVAREKQGVGGNTIRLDLALLRRLFNLLPHQVPGMESLIGRNPVVHARRPGNGSALSIPAGRERILSPEEQYRLLDALPSGLAEIVEFALETGMRKSEIMNLTWGQVGDATVRLGAGDTKTARSRVVPLTPRACEVIALARKVRGLGKYVFARLDVSRVFSKLAARAGIPSLHFHDLRHTAITRFFTWYGLGIEQVALISGHLTWGMLRRYTHLRAGDLVRALEEGHPQYYRPRNPDEPVF